MEKSRKFIDTVKGLAYIVCMKAAEVKANLKAVANTSKIHVKTGKGSMRGALIVFVYESNEFELFAICKELNKNYVNSLGETIKAINSKEFTSAIYPKTAGQFKAVI